MSDPGLKARPEGPKVEVLFLMSDNEAKCPSHIPQSEVVRILGLFKIELVVRAYGQACADIMSYPFAYRDLLKETLANSEQTTRLLRLDGMRKLFVALTPDEKQSRRECLVGFGGERVYQGGAE